MAKKELVSMHGDLFEVTDEVHAQDANAHDIPEGTDFCYNFGASANNGWFICSSCQSSWQVTWPYRYCPGCGKIIAYRINGHVMSPSPWN